MNTLPALIHLDSIRESTTDGRLARSIAYTVHEIRNPLSALQLHLQLLDRDVSSDFPETYPSEATPAGTVRKRSRTSERIRDLEVEILRIQRNLDDLACLAMMHEGPLKTFARDCEIVDLIRSLTQRFERLFELKGTTCRFSSNCRTLWAQVDPFRLEQVISNLLSNAWKYGEGKPVEVSLRTLPLSSNGVKRESISIEVRDQGRGMSPDILNKLFQPYFRPMNSSDQKGTGLGLVVVREIVAAMGGEISVQSEIKKGSLFSIILPTQNRGSTIEQ